MFFKSISNIAYKLGSNNTALVKDIFKRVGLKRPAVGKLALDSYYIQEGDTPEILAKKFYNNVYYHWIILVVNDIVNPYEEWPRNSNAMFAYTEDKYGVGNALKVHHYVLEEDTSIIVDYSTELDILPITNLDHEIAENDLKRRIWLLKPEFVKEFVSSYKKLMAI